MPGDAPSPRARMVYSAAQLVREQGVTATGVRDVVDHAGAPRGSFQHYFPGGKDQLIGEAVLWAGDFAARRVSEYSKTTRKPSPGGLFTYMVRQWKDEFGTRGYQRGCPVMAAAADLTGSDSTVNEQLRTALEQWRQAATDELVHMGLTHRRAHNLAIVMISALEGAIMWARIRRDTGPLDAVSRELVPLLNSGYPSTRTGT
jgi:AcrR family transcriptional regulator